MVVPFLSALTLTLHPTRGHRGPKLEGVAKDGFLTGWAEVRSPTCQVFQSVAVGLRASAQPKT